MVLHKPLLELSKDLYAWKARICYISPMLEEPSPMTLDVPRNSEDLEFSQHLASLFSNKSE